MPIHSLNNYWCESKSLLEAEAEIITDDEFKSFWWRWCEEEVREREMTDSWESASIIRDVLTLAVLVAASEQRMTEMDKWKRTSQPLFFSGVKRQYDESLHNLMICHLELSKNELSSWDIDWAYFLLESSTFYYELLPAPAYYNCELESLEGFQGQKYMLPTRWRAIQTEEKGR
jgi:hypothetical protein